MADGEGMSRGEMAAGIKQLMDLTAATAAAISMVVEFYPMDRRAAEALLDVYGSLTVVAGQEAVQEAKLGAEIDSWMKE